MVLCGEPHGFWWCGLDVLSLIVAHDPYYSHAPLGWIVQHFKIRRGGGFWYRRSCLLQVCQQIDRGWIFRYWQPVIWKGAIFPTMTTWVRNAKLPQRR